MSSRSTAARSTSAQLAGICLAIEIKPAQRTAPLDDERPPQGQLELVAPVERSSWPRMQSRLAPKETLLQPLNPRGFVPLLAPIHEPDAAPAREPLVQPEDARAPRAGGAEEEAPRATVWEMAVDDGDFAFQAGELDDNRRRGGGHNASRAKTRDGDRRVVVLRREHVLDTCARLRSRFGSSGRSPSDESSIIGSNDPIRRCRVGRHIRRTKKTFVGGAGFAVLIGF
jgi:hypothetical protein